jgi:hypothetical protein
MPSWDNILIDFYMQNCSKFVSQMVVWYILYVVLKDIN